ncbi:hypothetical protein EGM51_08110 [Verrucomicrobia bacterium S94]|nr:hypothetical protein EGM51_08110 [Verrucomicrobia bacterium S94]
MTDLDLTTRVRALATAAEDLQQSLLARDTDAIWNQLSIQEELLEEFACVQQNEGPGLKDIVCTNPEIRQLLRRSLRVVQANRALAQRFLEVVGQTLSHLGGAESPIYSGNGTVVVRRAPILVSQQG